MNRTHVTRGAQQALQERREAYRSTNLLENPGFADGLDRWTFEHVSLVYASDNRLAMLGFSKGDAWLSQSVENVPEGRYIVGFSYIADEATPGSRVQVLLESEEVGSFIIVPTGQTLYHCFLVADIKQTSPLTLKLARPADEVFGPHIDEVWLSRAGALPAFSLLRNGDFEQGDNGDWTLSENAEFSVVPIEPVGLQLCLGAAGSSDVWAGQTIVWPEGADAPPVTGVYTLAFQLHSTHLADPPPRRLGEIQIRVGGVMRESMGFHHDGGDRVTLDFVLDLSAAEFDQGVELRIVKLKTNEADDVVLWWLNDASLTLVRR